MTKYKNIEKYMGELKLHKNCDFEHGTNVVLPSDLENLLAKGVEVYGLLHGDNKDHIIGLTTDRVKVDTHSGLLLSYKPIDSQEPVSKSEIEQFINNSSNKFNRYEYADFLKKIVKNGVKND